MDRINDVLFNILVNLDTFARLPTNTDIYLNSKGYFSPIGGRFSSIICVQTLCNLFYYKYTPEQLLLDIEIYFKEIDRILKELYQLGLEDHNLRIDVASKIKLIAREFKFAYGDDTKGLFCLLHNYERSKYHEILFELVNNILESIKNYKNLTKYWLKRNYDALPYCSEEHFSDEDWILKIKNSHYLQYESTGFYKFYIQYTSSLWFNRTMSLLGYYHWYDEIFSIGDTKLYLGGMPLQSILGLNDVDTLSSLKVKSILSVVECFENQSTGLLNQPIMPSTWNNVGIHYLQVPICDFQEMPLEKVQTCVEYIKWNMDKSNTIYIHCRVARSRSVLIVMAYLVKYHGYTAADAYTYVKSKRPQIQHKHVKLLDKYALLLKA